MRADDKKKLEDLLASAVALAPGRAWMPLPAHGSPGIDWDTINDKTRKETDVLYCSLDLMVVGCQFYSGMLYRGEMSDLVREPNNPYDPNAIRCDNIHGTQVGHIKKEQAACLARILDDTSPLTPYVDVTVEKAGMSQFSVPVVARVYGPPQYKVQVTNYLAANGMRMREDGTGAGGSQQVPTVVSSRRIVNSVDTQKELDGLCSKLQEDMEKLDITGVDGAYNAKPDNINKLEAKLGQVGVVSTGGGSENVYYVPIKFANQKGSVGKMLVFEIILCTTTKSDKGFFRMGVPKYIYEKVESAFVIEESTHCKPYTQSNDQYIHMTVDHRKWKLGSGIPHIKMDVNGNTKIFTVERAFQQVKGTTLRCLAMARFSGSIKSAELCDSVLASKDWRIGMVIQDIKILDVEDTDLFRQETVSTAASLTNIMNASARIISMFGDLGLDDDESIGDDSLSGSNLLG